MTRSSSALRLQRILLVVVSIAFSFVGLELGFRWFRWHRLTQLEREDDPVYHHRLKPHRTFHQTSPDFDTHATTNALGLRGPISYGPKPAGLRRVLLLGDSFIFGVGVNDPETSCALLQQAIDPARRHVEIINAGLGGYSPLLHYLATRGLYLPLEPDAVVLFFDFGDLQDDFNYEHNLRADAQGRLLACDPNYFNGRFALGRYIRERSALAKYFYNQFVRTYQKIRILGLRRYLQAKLRGERAKGVIANLRGQARQVVDPLHYDQLLMIRDRSNLPEIRKHWQRTGRYILLLKDLLRERQIPFVLAAYPYGVQVGPDQWGKGRVAFGFQAGMTYDDPFAFEFLEEFARANEIPFINTYEAFRAARQERLFHDWDGHFTPAGHRVIAAELLNQPAFLNLLGQTQIAERSP